MRVSFERDLPHPPEVAWVLVTDPLQHDRWSQAHMSLLHAPGDPGAIGTRRRITLRVAGLPIRFDEEIVASDPPARLVYRVVPSVALRAHRGEVTLSPSGEDGARTRLRWRVEATFRIPGLGLVIGTLLRRQLGGSLDALATLPTTAAAEPEVLSQLFAEAEAALAEQRRLAGELAAAREPGQWFANVYAQVTAAQLGACRAGAFTHPDWVLRLVARFHTFYVTNVSAWRSGRRDEAEPHWRAAFEAGERAPAVTDRVSGGVTRGLSTAIRAHVDGDLPLALAEVYLQHYAGEVDYGSFAADYRRMEAVFPRVQRALMRRIPGAVRAMLSPMPQHARMALASRLTYDVPGRRARAFRRGEQVAALIAVLGHHRARPLVKAVVPALASDDLATDPIPAPASTVTAINGTDRLVQEHLEAALEATELFGVRSHVGPTGKVLVDGPAAIPVAAEIAHAVRHLLEIDYPRLGPGSFEVALADPDAALRSVPRLLRGAVAVALARTGVRIDRSARTATSSGGPPGARVGLHVHAPLRTGRARLLAAFCTARWRVRRDVVLARQAERDTAVRWVSFDSGDVIVRQGDRGSCLYVIEQGEVDVVADMGNSQRLLARLGPGDHFGERAVFGGGERIATVRARTPVRALLSERVHAVTLSQTVPTFGEAISQLPRGHGRAPERPTH